MHPEVNAFAGRPTDLNGPSTPKLRRTRPGRDSDDDTDSSLDRAVIYSPSTGDLSVYTRQTPSPNEARQVRKLAEPQETPTKKPLHKVGRDMLKRSVSTFFKRSSSVMKLNLSPSNKAKTEGDLTAINKRATWAYPSPSITNSSVQKRGRSVSSPDMHNVEGMRAVWDYQPSTPSPLRNSTRLTISSGGRERAVTTTTPIRVPVDGLMLAGPRSATVLSNPERRYGRYVGGSISGESP